MKTIFDWITEYALNGIATVPIVYKTKIPGLSWSEYKEKLPSADELLKWFGGSSLVNYGVVVGWNKLVVLDFDNIDMFHKWYLWGNDQDESSAVYKVIDSAFMVQSARGMHVYVAIDEPLRNMSINGLDIKANGMVLGPGSTHPSGAIYKAMNNSLTIPKISKLSDILFEDWSEQLNTEPKSDFDGDPLIFSNNDDPFESAVLIGTERAVERIKHHIRIQDILSGVINTGEHWYMALCPFHKDRNPSFWIDDRRQIGNCQKCNFQRPLDVVNIYARLHQIDEGDAIRTLARMI